MFSSRQIHRCDSRLSLPIHPQPAEASRQRRPTTDGMQLIPGRLSGLSKPSTCQLSGSASTHLYVSGPLFSSAGGRRLAGPRPSLLPFYLAGHVEGDGLARTCFYRKVLTGMLFRFCKQQISRPLARFPPPRSPTFASRPPNHAPLASWNCERLTPENHIHPS